MSFVVQFTPQNQVKTEEKKSHRVLRCSVSTVPLTADIYQLIFQREGGRDPSDSPPLNTPLIKITILAHQRNHGCLSYSLCFCKRNSNFLFRA